MSDILLDAYAARSCPVKTQNAYDPTVAPVVRDDQANLERFTGTQDFKDLVLAPLAELPGTVDLRSVDRGEGRTDQTLTALRLGAPIILGPRLPLDRAGHRRGSPDALLRHGETTEGQPAYLPLQVKRHMVLEKQKSPAGHLVLSPLTAPFPSQGVEPEQWRFRSSRAEDDLVQLAHYHRMLEGMGFASRAGMAGLIGLDTPSEVNDPEVGGGHVVAWIDLSVKFVRTFSRTAESGWKLRSPLERYDHEFSFRVKVAQTAATNLDGSVRPMVQPIRIRACESCEWWERCAPTLPEDDLSLRIDKSPLDVREISVLRHLGINTIDDLLSTDVDALLPTYLPEVRHRSGAEGRLRLAARRAALLQQGVALQRVTTGDLGLAEAELEIDFDIETSSSDQTYLWGFLVHDRATGEPPWYRAFTSFDDLDTSSETALAAEALAWLGELTAGRDAVVYHYSDYELVHLHTLAVRSDHEAIIAMDERKRDLFVDLFLTMRDHYFGARGLGLKVVAAEGPGFHWRDIEPSGLASQKWYDEARQAETEDGRQAAQIRLLEYNEDDVRATHALREWLRTQRDSDATITDVDDQDSDKA